MSRKVFYNGIADGALLFAGIVSSVVLTRLLGPDRWGKYSQMIWLINFSAMLAGFGLTYTSMRFIANLSGANDKANLKLLVEWILIAQLLLALLSSALVFLFSDRLIALTGWQVNPSLVRVTSFGIFSYTLLQLGNAMLRGLQEFRFLSLVSICSGGLLLSAILVVFLRPEVSTLIISISIGQLLLLPWIFSKVWMRVIREGIPSGGRLPGIWKSALSYTIIIFFTTLIDQIVWQRSEIFFLARLPDPSHSGFYSLSYTISQMSIGTVPVALTGILTPVFASMAESKPRSNLDQLFKRSFSYLNLILLPSAVGLIIVAPKLIALLYGEGFLSAAPVLQIIAISTALGIYTRPGASVLHALNKPIVLLLAGLVALPVDLVLAWQLVPGMFARGAAIANLAAQFVCAGLIVGYGIFAVGLRVNLASLIKTLLSSIICGIIAKLILLLEMDPLFTLPLAIIVASISYLISLILLKDEPTTEILSNLKRMFFYRYREAEHRFTS